MSEYTRNELLEKIRNGESLYRADLVGVDLSGTDLSGANLREANFMGAKLQEAYLSGADLRKTNLWGAKLAKTDLKTADLSGADLSGADLSEANLSGAFLIEANLRDANLGGANLSGAFLGGAFLKKAFLSAALLNGANLSLTNLREANLREAKLWKANLMGASLRGADLVGANLSSADFEYADLNGADISGANIFQIKTHGWRIEDLLCTHAYQCNQECWQDSDIRESYRCDFPPGQFGKLFKSLPTIEMVFKDGISPLEYLSFLGLVGMINQERPDFDLKIKTLDKVGLDTFLRFTLSEDEQLEEAIRLMAQLSREQQLEQKLSSVLRKKLNLPLKSKTTQLALQGCNNITMCYASGEVKKSTVNIAQIKAAKDHLAIVEEGMVAHQAETKELLATLREVIHEENKKLIKPVKSLTKAIEAKDQEKTSQLLAKIENAVDTDSQTFSLVKKIGGLLSAI